MFEPSTYTITEGVDSFAELTIKVENIKIIVAINVSLAPGSAEGMYNK